MAARLVCFANSGSRRTDEWARACRETTGTELCIVPWLDVIRGTWDRSGLRGGPTLRLESPGKDAAVEQALLLAGADLDDPEGDSFWRMTARQVERENWERGRIPPMRQWYLGWCKVLRDLASEAGPDARWLTPPEDVISMFDKSACQTQLAASGVPVPRSPGVPRDYFHAMELAGGADCRRFFLKSRHGSSASGILAIECGPQGLQAFTTVDLRQHGPVMYNSRKVRRLQGNEVMETADAVCSLGAVIQAWVPKAGWRGCTMDLRAVTIKGRARHIVPRLSRSPFTTLQLGAQRGDAAALRAESGEAAWQRVTDAAERAAAAYPGSLMAGVDIAVTPGWNHALVLEMNAFGDLLPGVLHEGRDTYVSQLAAAGIL